MKKKLFLLLVLITILLNVTGCKQDNMEDIDIAITNYPNEYIVNRLYGEHSTINRVYPDGIDISSYNVTKKQKDGYANMGLFVYTGLINKERKLAVDLLSINSDLKIIDTSYVLETEYSNEELWLNPSSLLMMAQNVRLGLKEYVTSNYLSEKIDKEYNKLKVDLSELDADYRLAVENTANKVIVVSDESLKFLETFGLKVYVLDSNTTEKDIVEINNLFKNGYVNYIFKYKDKELNTVATNVLKNNTNIKTININKLDNISDEERDDGKDYLSIMNENLDSLKQELYQ